MADLREQLIVQVEELADVKVALWKETDLLCVFYKDREIAHFQNDHEIDIRLTPAIIKRKGLQPPTNTTSHLDRAQRSRWIVQSFTTEEELSNVFELLKIATEL